jgi:hypothetical protein
MNALAKRRSSGGALSSALGRDRLNALKIGTDLVKRRRYGSDLASLTGGLSLAREGHSNLLHEFLGWLEAQRTLREMLDEPLDVARGLAMVKQLYRGLGKDDAKTEAYLEGALDMVEFDVVGEAMGCEPAKITTSTLAMACRTLNAVGSEFAPAPSQLRAACIEARKAITEQLHAMRTAIEAFRRHDADLLLHAREEWERIWAGEHDETRELILEMHLRSDQRSIWNAASDFLNPPEDDDVEFLAKYQQQRGVPA